MGGGGRGVGLKIKSMCISFVPFFPALFVAPFTYAVTGISQVGFDSRFTVRLLDARALSCS